MGYTWIDDSSAAPGSITEPYLALVVTGIMFVAPRISFGHPPDHHYPRRPFRPYFNFCRFAADFRVVGSLFHVSTSLTVKKLLVPTIETDLYQFV